MKKIKILSGLSFLLLVLLGLASCKKDNDDGGSMTAKVDGVAWSADIVGATIIGDVMNITGQTNAGETITITIQDNQPDTFYLDGGHPHAAAYVPHTGASGFTTNSPGGFGVAVVSEINQSSKTLSGRFELFVVNPATGEQKQISEGQFSDVTFETQAPITGNSTLSCKIDGQTFSPASVIATASGGKIIIAANSPDLNKTIGITVPAGAVTGSHDFEFFGDYVGQYNINQSTFLIADSGKVTISKHDLTNHILEGTFEFSATDLMFTTSADITAGTFKVFY